MSGGRPVLLPSSKRAKVRTGETPVVSLTSTLGKVMEQILLEVITKHAEEQNVMRSSQYEFTRGKSCLTNLIAVCDGMAGWIDKRRAVAVVYLDFSKAFTLSPITSS